MLNTTQINNPAAIAALHARVTLLTEELRSDNAHLNRKQIAFSAAPTGDDQYQWEAMCQATHEVEETQELLAAAQTELAQALNAEVLTISGPASIEDPRFAHFRDAFRARPELLRACLWARSSFDPIAAEMYAIIQAHVADAPLFDGFQMMCEFVWGPGVYEAYVAADLAKASGMAGCLRGSMAAAEEVAA